MLHTMLLIAMPGILLLFLSGLLFVKTLQLCQHKTCPACRLEGYEQTTQTSRSSQTRHTTRGLDCVMGDRETKFI